MTITLHNLRPNPGATKKRKRVGRGPGSGRGKTSVRGQKGQKSRTGSHGGRKGFEGGQMPLQMRLPKRGFKNPFRSPAHPVNLTMIEERFEPGDIDIDMLRAAGLLPRKAKIIKILGTGEVSKKFNIAAHRFSQSAIKKIEEAGGSVTVLGKGVASAAPADAPASTDE